MKKRSFLTLTAMLFAIPFLFAAPDSEEDPVSISGDREADATFVYARRETGDLLMDIYYPRPGSEIMVNGKKRPTLLFAFGGGFTFGDRKKPKDIIWFNEMARRGYTVVSIDYRLGLKGMKAPTGFAVIKAYDRSIHLVVEDIFAATNFLLKNAEDLQIDPKNIVLAGSSAGAISALQADYELCNRTSWAAVLPEDFHYAGVISFAGAILSMEGRPNYRKSEPAPTLLIHGTKDKVVTYKQTRFFNVGFFGSDKLAKRFKHFHYNYSIVRYEGNGHEIANSEMLNLEVMEDFIISNIMEGKKKITDALISHPGIEKGNTCTNRKQLYEE